MSTSIKTVPVNAPSEEQAGPRNWQFEKKPSVLILTYSGYDEALRGFCVDRQTVGLYFRSSGSDFKDMGLYGCFGKLGRTSMFGLRPSREDESAVAVGMFAEEVMLHFPLLPRDNRQLSIGASWEMAVVPVYANLNPPYGIGVAKPSQKVVQKVTGTEEVLGYDCARIEYSFTDTYDQLATGDSYGYKVQGVSFFALNEGLIVKQLETVRIVKRHPETGEFVGSDTEIRKKVLLIHSVPFRGQERKNRELPDADYPLSLLRKNFLQQPPEILEAIPGEAKDAPEPQRKSK